MLQYLPRFILTLVLVTTWVSSFTLAFFGTIALVLADDPGLWDMALPLASLLVFLLVRDRAFPSESPARTEARAPRDGRIPSA